jgi:hypothetical protein
MEPTKEKNYPFFDGEKVLKDLKAQSDDFEARYQAFKDGFA